MYRAFLALFLLAAFLVPAGAAGPELATDQDKTLYALGRSVARGLGGFELSEKEVAVVVSGLTDGVLGKPERVPMQEYGPKIQALAEERMAAAAGREKEAAKGFLESAAKEKGAEQTASGLIYKELRAGEGKSPEATSRVKVHYHGTLRDGSVFDSSVERKQPATFGLNQVIPCWTEGVQKMKAGGKAKLVCPADLAYGDRGAPPKISPGAPLVFEVELLEVLE